MIEVFSVYGHALYKDKLRTVKKLIAQGIAYWIDPTKPNQSPVRMARPTEAEVRLFKLKNLDPNIGDWRVVQPNFEHGGTRVIAQWCMQ